jgi:hypothetical protein
MRRSGVIHLLTDANGAGRRTTLAGGARVAPTASPLPDFLQLSPLETKLTSRPSNAWMLGEDG